MNKKINSKGITLIALVITIVVLLILAGISINMVLGDNGIVSKANKAKTETEYAEKKEQVSTSIAEAYIDRKGGTITPSDVVINLNNSYHKDVIYTRDTSDYDIAKDKTYDDIFPAYIVYPDNTKIYVNENNKVDEPKPNDNGYTERIDETITEVPNDYIPIYSVEELKRVGTSEVFEVKGTSYTFTPDAKYILMNNITLTEEWTPLSTEFTGLFEGNQKTIAGMTICKNDSEILSVGLFRESSGKIQNLNLSKINIEVNNEGDKFNNIIGGIVGTLKNGGYINNCIVSGKIDSKCKYAGGIVGNIKNLTLENAIIENCTNNVNVQAVSTACLAGIAGGVSEETDTTKITIKNCVNNANMVGYKDVSGILGGRYSSESSDYTGEINIINCVNKGNLEALYVAGMIFDTGKTKINIKNSANLGNLGKNTIYAFGIMGYNGGTAKLSDCYNTGDIIANTSTSGIAYRITGTESEIYNCYNTGKISGNGGAYKSGIINESNGSTIMRCYNTGAIEGNCGLASGICSRAINETRIQECYNSGNIDATCQKASGICSEAVGTNSISDSYNVGNLKAIYFVIGICYADSNNTTIENCYSAGSLESTNPDAMFYNIGSGNLENTYYLENQIIGNGIQPKDQATLKTETEMKSQEFVDLLNQNAGEGVTWKKTSTYPSFN